MTTQNFADLPDYNDPDLGPRYPAQGVCTTGTCGLPVYDRLTALAPRLRYSVPVDKEEPDND